MIHKKGKDHPNYGKKQSKETIRKKTQGQIGKKRSKKSKKNISEGSKGKKYKKIECPHCSRLIGNNNISRHIPKCKKTIKL